MAQNIFLQRKLIAPIVTIAIIAMERQLIFTVVSLRLWFLLIENKSLIKMPEFIKKQDGAQKQDCENAAVKRWLKKNPKNKYGNRVTLLGDDLYSHQPICELALEQDYNFIFVCLKSSHQTLYEWLDFLDRNGEVRTIEKKKWTGRKNLIYRYRYAAGLPLRDEESSLLVNWCEVTVINEKTQEIIYQNNWITNHRINDDNVAKIVKAGRSRWKIENEGNNVLKNHGYNERT